MKILAIETSCDETAMALVEASGGLKSPKFKILKNLVSSQIPVHRPFGGVVPNLAKREHLKNLPILIKRIMNYESGIRNKAKKNIIHNSKFIIPDILAVTVGPGLEPALWTGINFAKEIHQQFKIPALPAGRQSSKFKVPLIGVNHLEGHLYSFLLSQFYEVKPRKIRFPAVQLLVSGGHTILVLMKSLTNWRKLGETRDDAVGECFDKVGRMLGLPFPGGPEIERLANEAKKLKANATIHFPRPMINSKDYDFSFSGLKTSVLYYLRDNFGSGTSDAPNIARKLRTSDVQNIAASFQQAAIDVLVSKTIRAAKEFGAKSIMLSGGVAANKALRKSLKAESSKLKADFLVAPMKFNTDNAAMIAVAAYIQQLQNKKRAIRAQANLNL